MDNRYYSFQEFAQAFEKKWIKTAIEHGLVDEQMDIYLAKVRKNALFVWKKNQGDEWIEKQGYIIVDRKPSEEEIIYKKLGRGRPRKHELNRLQHAIHVRLDEETYQKLLSLCQKSNLDLSETIRMLIKKG
ncbi:AT hook motif family protein [Brevibacillus laterosporus]|nr:AT hook motif family protein [Brevibacillus laterosporus]ATO51663.1 AT hook motif family protein [Brevibacillus laterosporus DSM 25]MBG9803912.1 AT hook motif family protein [Brevibacillus laterosporus]MED2005223.1 AT hook motif family protein [Brevibacillus laterosporus]MED4763522.1 AT hook motif family protein [Brevibacillus laterosporus]TPH16348.1 AT hook motif family protein [Brevibacillus laterosporus]